MARRIGIDMDGGDETPEGSVAERMGEGAREFLRDSGEDIDLVFYGNEQNISNAFGRRGVPGKVVKSTAYHPKGKVSGSIEGTSLNNLFWGLRRKDIDSVYTIGDTTKVLLELSRRIKRIRLDGEPISPTLVVRMPSKSGYFLLTDAGAGNGEERAMEIYQKGIITAAYARHGLGIDSVRLGVLSNGEEGHKGNAFVKSVDDLFRSTDFGRDNSFVDYQGMKEPKHAYGGELDILLTDGFTGNVLLKGVGDYNGLLSDTREKNIGRLSSYYKFLGLLGKPASDEVRAGVERDLGKRFVGGAVLLGYNGVVVKGHGTSSAERTAGGLRVASMAFSDGLAKDINDALREYRPMVD